MERISFIESLIAFNERVLCNGTITPEKLYTMNELKQKLFFNKIFIENMEEVFQRHDCTSIIDRYVENLSKYIENISMILGKMRVFDPSIQIRLHGITDAQKDQLVSTHYPNDYKFLNGEIYYISNLDDGQLVISQMKSYPNTPCQKSDECIIGYLNETYRTDSTIAIRPVVSAHDVSKVSKVEFNGRSCNAKDIINLFGSETLIVSNPFIYTDDIKNTIEGMIPPTPIKIEQKFENITFEDIFNNDILIEYPVTSFDVYLHLLSLASIHKGMKAIYISLYRIGKDPIIYSILKDAVKHGIDVYVNIELCASGESINSVWAEEMRNVGIHVTTYATGKLKVHSKLTLFEFKHGKVIAQIGTGNYHTQTTSQYTDLSLITSDVDICNQVLNVFNIFNDKLDNVIFNNNLLVTRYNARDELIKLIRREAKLGENGYIAFKCNALDDKEIAAQLDKAAANNCQIDLIVRGVCTWIPDQLGYNVRIKSVVWDKLEHSRLYCFGSFNPTIYVGSLDLVSNKLNNRIETLVKVLDPDILDDLCEYLNQYITNTDNSWELLRSGEYRKEEI